MINKYFFIFILLIISITANSQITASSALKLFNEKNYDEAKIEYEELLSRNSRDLTSNYYYGVILYELKIDDSEAIKRLRFSSQHSPSTDYNYYLGKLYQRSYENEMAIDHFQRFIKSAKQSDERVEESERAIEDCLASINLINKHFSIQVIKKDTVDIENILSYYKLSKDAGQLLKAGDFFKIGVNQENVIFRTERGSEVLFPIQESNGNYDLYKIVRLLDKWTDAEKLEGNVNSEHNDLYPFMLIDGVTLYFSSDRPGGMGGFDVYQSFYDPESGEFSEPANLGPPFNSPEDDFLLVPDVFEGKAWFSTTRGVKDGKVVVTEIIWDENVVRSFTEDVNQIKMMASLPISENARVRASSTLYSANEEIAVEKVKSFEFIVNDTLLYTKYEDFKSKEALLAFKEGQKFENQKDSLTSLMRLKRNQYARSYDQLELKNLIDEIIALEKRTYGLDDNINNYYHNARVKEINTINQLLAQGAYQKTGIKKKSKRTRTEEILAELNKGDLTFYSDEIFIKRKEKVEPMYRKIFSPEQIDELLRLDSLYVWANIITLESAKVLEQTNKPTEEKANIKDKLFNSEELEEQENFRIQELIKQSRNYKQDALEIYDYTLNQKFSVYYPMAKEYGATTNDVGNQNMLSQSRTIFNEADDNLKELGGYNPEREERFLALKRMSVDMLENSFFQYQDKEIDMSQQSRFLSNNTGNSRPVEQNVNITNQQTAPKKPKTVEQTKPTQKPIYKVQIGVFQNEPNATAVSKIPKISYEEMPNRNLKKYFSGSWNTYEEAQSCVESIRAAGFPGAFVVAFVNNVSIPIGEARKLQ